MKNKYRVRYKIECDILPYKKESCNCESKDQALYFADRLKNLQIDNVKISDIKIFKLIPKKMIKQAKEVQIGDYVMSEGSFKKVKRIIKGQSAGNIMSFSPNKNENLDYNTLISSKLKCALIFELNYYEELSYSDPFLLSQLVEVRSKTKGNPYD